MSLARSSEVNSHVYDVLAILKPYMWLITPLLLISVVDARSNSNSRQTYDWRFKNEDGIAYRGEFQEQCWFEEFVQRAVAECNALSRKADLSKIVYDEVTCYKFNVYEIGRYDKHGNSTFEDCFCEVMKEVDKYCTEQAWLTAGYVTAAIVALCCCACFCIAGYFCIKSGMISDCFESMSNHIINGRQRVISALSIFQPAATSDHQPSQSRELRTV